MSTSSFWDKDLSEMSDADFDSLIELCNKTLECPLSR